MEERKHEKEKTTKMLDFVGKKYDYEDEKNMVLKREFEKELEKREPFDDIKHAIQKQEKRIKELEEMMEKICHHSHNFQDGEIVIPLKTVNRNYW